MTIKSETEAREFGMIAAADKAVTTETNHILDAKLVDKRGKLTLLVRLAQAYGDKLNDFPIVDSEGDNHPAKWKDTVDGREKTVDWYFVFVEEQPEYIRLNALKNKYTKTAANDGTGADVGEGERLSELGTVNGRINELRSLYKGTLRLHQNMTFIKENCTLIECDYFKTDDGEIDLKDKRTYPIQMWPQGQPGKVKTFSIGQVIAMKPRLLKDPSKATLTELMATSSKAPAPGANKFAVKNVKECEQAIAGLAHYLDNEADTYTKRRDALLKLLQNDKGALKSFAEFMFASDDVWTVVQPIYNAAFIDRKAIADKVELGNVARTIAQKHNAAL